MELQTFKVSGTLELVLTDKNGVVQTQRKHNIVTNVGLAYIASRIKDASATAMTHMAIGSNNTAAAAGNTALGNELGRVTLDSTTLVTTTLTNDTVQYVAVFPAGTSTGTITEAGLFNASSAGSLLCRSVFAAIAKSAEISLTITWKLQVTR